MLILTRKVEETIYIGDDIAVTVLAAGGGRVRLGISAPPTVNIRRGELIAQSGPSSTSKTEEDQSEHWVCSAGQPCAY